MPHCGLVDPCICVIFGAAERWLVEAASVIALPLVFIAVLLPHMVVAAER